MVRFFYVYTVFDWRIIAHIGAFVRLFYLCYLCYFLYGASPSFQADLNQTIVFYTVA